MDRNLSRRVEVVFPIEQPELNNGLVEILDTSLADKREGAGAVVGRQVPPGDAADGPRRACAARSVTWRSPPRTPPAAAAEVPTPPLPFVESQLPRHDGHGSGKLVNGQWSVVSGQLQRSPRDNPWGLLVLKQLTTDN